jgi:uncharacterized protein
MIGSDFLEILRCPLNPSRTRLVLQDNKLICERCALCFPIKDGFPILVAEEAELPPGCESLGDLPCQKADARAPGANKGEGSPRAPQQKDASTG